MSIISGMRTASADLNQIGACGVFLSEVADLARQAELDKYGLQALAGANVLSSLAGHRRDALWAAAAAAPDKHPASRHTKHFQLSFDAAFAEPVLHNEE
jgi:error-prone DNA polymerase